MKLRRTRGRQQDRGDLALPGEPASPGPQSAASRARVRHPGSLSGSPTARAAAEQGRDRSGTAQTALALSYAVRSDVGLLREGNEDSAYAGPHLLAVADGMGGHAAGEVASAAAVTTLTALLWSQGYAVLCHIGDSRAYLLRDGQFIQVTRDHTLVQSLVDEGTITEDDVAAHPYRSLLLRALDGRTIAEPDLTPLETYPGDRYLLCSDGLSGVVSEQTLHQVLASVRDLDEVTSRLVGLAIEGGGPDNITCIVADVIDARSSRALPTWQPVFAGAAASGAQADLSRRLGTVPRRPGPCG